MVSGSIPDGPTTDKNPGFLSRVIFLNIYPKNAAVKMIVAAYPYQQTHNYDIFPAAPACEPEPGGLGVRGYTGE